MSHSDNNSAIALSTSTETTETSVLGSLKTLKAKKRRNKNMSRRLKNAKEANPIPTPELCVFLEPNPAVADLSPLKDDELKLEEERASEQLADARQLVARLEIRVAEVTKELQQRQTRALVEKTEKALATIQGELVSQVFLKNNENRVFALYKQQDQILTLLASLNDGKKLFETVHEESKSAKPLSWAVESEECDQVDKAQSQSQPQTQPWSKRVSSGHANHNNKLNVSSDASSTKSSAIPRIAFVAGQVQFRDSSGMICRFGSECYHILKKQPVGKTQCPWNHLKDCEHVANPRDCPRGDDCPYRHYNDCRHGNHGDDQQMEDCGWNHRFVAWARIRALAGKVDRKTTRKAGISE